MTANARRRGGPSVSHPMTGKILKGQKYKFFHMFKGYLVGTARKISLPYVYFELEPGTGATLINVGLIMAIEEVKQK